jgi:hypothetical protein
MNTRITEDYISEFINDGWDAYEIRGRVIGFLILLIDVFMGLVIIGDPFEAIYRNVLLPPMILMNLYAIWIAISPYKRQIDVHLYLGIFGVFIYAGYWVLLQKIMYGMMGLSSPFYLIGSLVLYAAIAVFTIRFILNRFYSGRFNEPVPVSVIAPAAAGGVGVALGHLALAFDNGHYANALAGAAYTMIAWGLLVFGVYSLLRYSLIRRYPDLFYRILPDEEYEREQQHKGKKRQNSKSKGV